MICTHCGKNNPEGVRFCAYCGQPIGIVPAQIQAGYPAAPEGPTRSRPSGAAVASVVLGALGFCSAGITGLAGLIIGIIALVQIRASGGRLTGTPAAVVGIIVSALTLLIIPLYAAMMYPAIKQQRGIAGQTTCISHVKQLGLGALMYSQDWDERYMLKSNWCDSIMPYVKNLDVYRCPALPDARTGYAYNAAFAPPLKAEKVRAPASAVLLFEGPGAWNTSGGPEQAVARHQDRLSIGFADGHVRLMPLTAAQTPGAVVWDPKAEPAYGLSPSSAPSP